MEPTNSNVIPFRRDVNHRQLLIDTIVPKETRREFFPVKRRGVSTGLPPLPSPTMSQLNKLTDVQEELKERIVTLEKNLLSLMNAVVHVSEQLKLQTQK